jgi:hypothetical protein
MKMQYVAKPFSLARLTSLIISLHAHKPVKKAEQKPIIRADNSLLPDDIGMLSMSSISNIILPKIRGTTIKKLNRAAFSLSMPNNTEVEIVAPDLEIPGKIAIA